MSNLHDASGKCPSQSQQMLAAPIINALCQELSGSLGAQI